MKYQNLGQILISKGVITKKNLDFCLAVQKSDPVKRKIGYYIVYYNFACEKDIALALSETSGYKFFDSDFLPNMKVFEKIKVDFLIERRVYPLLTQDNEIFTFVLTDVYDTDTTDFLEAKFGKDTIFFIAAENKVAWEVEKIVRKINRSEVVEDISLNNEIPADKLALNILEYAISCLATDIHIEPSETVLEIRLRIDGVLQFYRSLPLAILDRLTNVFFHKAEVPSSDFMHNHDARFKFEYLRKVFDVRLSHIHNSKGSGLCLRLLDKTKAANSTEELGYVNELCQILQGALRNPNGIVLLTGPTGCGKSTSLYAMINSKKDLSIKIISAEDPVEIQIPLVTQVQVDSKKGHTFASIVRSSLRHDPDVIMIGEIRDTETANIAVTASQTGHLVLSTVHCNNPVSALLRLKNLGIDYSQLASTVRCIIAQRLVRKLCNLCKQKKIVKQSDLDQFSVKYLKQDKQEVGFAVGCVDCGWSGYDGRTIVAEALCIDKEIEMLIEQGKINEIQANLNKQDNYLTMQKDAMRLISETVLSLEEAVRILG